MAESFKFAFRRVAEAKPLKSGAFCPRLAALVLLLQALVQMSVQDQGFALECRVV